MVRIAVLRPFDVTERAGGAGLSVYDGAYCSGG
jgi:hypothetical protein